MSESKADPKCFNTVIDTTPSGLHGLQYYKLTNSTIYTMEDSVLYVKSKIKGRVYSRKSVSKHRDLSNTDSDEPVLLDQDGFGKSEQLSSDTLNKFCEMLPYYVSFSSHLHVCK